MEMTIPSLEQKWSKDSKYQTTGAVYYKYLQGMG